LRDLTKLLKDGIRNMGFDMNHTEVPIVTIALGSEKRTVAVHQALLDRNIFAIHSRYIGAGPGGALRFAVMANHTPEQLEHLLAILGELV